VPRGVGVLYGGQRRRSVTMGNGQGRNCGRAGGGRKSQGGSPGRAWVG
jgi:hypothetical protein